MLPLADVVSPVAQQIIYVIPPEYQYLNFALIGIVVLETLYIVWKLYKDFTSIWCIDELSDGLFRIKKIPLKKVKENKIPFGKDDKREITTRVGILKRPLGINVPLAFTRWFWAGTVPLLDPRKPPKDQYIDPKVFSEALLSEAEKQLQTVHIEKKPLDFILPMLAGAGVMLIIAMFLGWLK